MLLEVHIPERFRRAVLLHVIKNLMPEDVVRPALLLGIHGPSGEGKTFQCEHILERENIKSFLLSGGQFESPEAGEPARLLRSTYINASKALEREEALGAVVVINDVDTGLGNWGNMTQYTVNRQTVFGELMHLVDYPTDVDGRQTRRIPIILTGNDFTKLYEPLVRAGRMSAFEWRLAGDERIDIVARIFPELTRHDCCALLSHLESIAKELSGHSTETLPLAFYSHLKNSLVDDFIWKEVNASGAKQILHAVTHKRVVPRIKTKVDLPILLRKGEGILRQGQLVNHLRR